ncbi:glycosyltransferase [Desulfovibrio sp. ZJ200]|uniref:glycosyltransferase n=1 Tax=Desulfovibrio sp. ZJ200 TaxID=2709792 RepID=UPI00198204F7|nr:glycosyltransferase [Desulfovibrio sp. ZJ200]
MKKKILITDTRVPHHDMVAADHTTFHICRDLASFGFDVTFLPGMDTWPEKYGRDLKALGVRLDYERAVHGTPADYLRRFAGEFSIFYLQPLWLAHILIDIVKKENPQAEIIYHAADLTFVRLEREKELLHAPQADAKASEARSQELDIAMKADHVIVISDTEKQILQKAVGHRLPVHSFNCLYSGLIEKTEPFSGRNGILFVGSYGHQPNVDGILWFADCIWPLFRKRFPTVPLYLVGGFAPPEITELDRRPGISYLGHVEDLTPLLQSATVAIAPLRYGAGIKGKIGMTLGAGLPNVCTPMAVEGMQLENEKHVLIARDERMFADSLERLHSDEKLWKRLSDNGKEVIHKKFGIEACSKRFKAILEKTGIMEHES